MTWILEKHFKFEASHQLPKHDGKCARLHGHSWSGRIYVEGAKLAVIGPKSGMVMDYKDLAVAIDPVVEQYLDHYHLNETTGLDNPTSEELARWIYYKVKARLPELTAVSIDETCTTRCTYKPE